MCVYIDCLSPHLEGRDCLGHHHIPVCVRLGAQRIFGRVKDKIKIIGEYWHLAPVQPSRDPRLTLKLLENGSLKSCALGVGGCIYPHPPQALCVCLVAQLCPTLATP